MREIYVLDACALIALIKYENGALAVAELCKEAEENNADLLINIINLLEVYYGFRRERGEQYAESILEKVMDSIVKISEVNMTILKEAGRIKSEYNRISLADSIALAEALTRGGYLVTADHHEMDIIDKAEVVRFLWIR